MRRRGHHVPKGTICLRGGKNGYSQNTLIGNWEEDREIVPAASLTERPGYQTTKGVAEFEATKKKTKYFGAATSEHKVSDIIHYGESHFYRKDEKIRRKEKESRKLLSPQQMQEYRKVWSYDETRESRFLTENKINNNSAVPEKFQTGVLRDLPNAPVVVQEFREDLLQNFGPNVFHKMKKTFRLGLQQDQNNITKKEFGLLLRDFFKIDIQEARFEVLWHFLDPEGHGSVNFDDNIIKSLLGPLNQKRKALISDTYFGKTCNKGPSDLLHLKDLLDMMNQEKAILFRRFFDDKDNDDIVTLDEFTEFYHGYSASIRYDGDFESLLESDWP